jgi:hypothetical protein
MNDTSPILEAQGLGHVRLLLFQDGIRIERKRMQADIQLSSVNDIQIKKVGFRRRYIEFSFVNSLEKKGVLVYFHDKTGIKFKLKHLPAFEAIKIAIKNRKNTR